MCVPQIKQRSKMHGPWMFPRTAQLRVLYFVFDCVKCNSTCGGKMRCAQRGKHELSSNPRALPAINGEFRTMVPRRPLPGLLFMFN